MDAERWQRVQEVLAEALERDAAERDELVARRCGGDEELRAEVVSLLQAAEEADDYFDDLGGRAGIPRPDESEEAAGGTQDARDAPMNRGALGIAGSETGAGPGLNDDPLIGRRVSHFDVTGFLGQGGMGKVYRATDVELGRDVALKVLADELAGNPAQAARLKREAQALAALNHPNIAAIYGVEKIDGHQALVLELIEGESLADVLRRGRRGGLRMREALDIARQVAAALEAAHDKGIVHRDLKPANVALTAEHRAKVLDFGIAKALQPDVDVDGDPEWSPTEVMAATQPGRIMGTVSYMSPEQARGKPVDARTDVWAFGCVLFEMLAGKKSFAGDTATDTIVAILEREPDWDALPDALPAEIRALLRRCLQKDPRRRLRSIGDAWLVIDEVLEMPAAERVPSGAAATPAWRAALLWALVALLAVVAAWALLSDDPADTAPTRRLEIAASEDDLLSPLGGRALALSPDGSRLAYTAAGGLALRPLDAFDATLMNGTVGAESPFFSPDGEWVGYFARGRLWKVSVRGGAPFELCDAITPRGAHWSDAGGRDTIVFSDGTALWRVAGPGGECVQIAAPDAAAGEVRFAWPSLLPGGSSGGGGSGSFGGSGDPDGAGDPDNETVLFELVGEGWSSLALLSPASGEITRLADGGSDARYLPTGHIVYARGGALFAVPFDLERLAVTGDPRPVLDSVRTESTGAAHLAFSAGGTLAYVPTSDPDYRLVWVDRSGAVTPVSETRGDYAAPRISPDGTRIALAVRRAGEQHVWVHDIARDVQQQLTSEGSNSWPDWTPDGRRVVFSSGRRGPSSIWWKPVDDGAAEQLARTDGVQYAVSVADDAEIAAFFQVAGGSSRDIWVLPLTNEAVAVPAIIGPEHEQGAALSPDGRWLAYVSNASGRNEVWVQPCLPCTGESAPASAATGRRQISFNGGGEPVWHPNGRELFFREGDRMMSVTFDLGDDFRATRPQVLFTGSFAPGQSGNRYYDIHPDGERFVMLQPAGPDPQRPRINVVLNWFTELQRAFSR